MPGYAIKINLTTLSITEFLYKNTDLNLGELMVQSLTDFINGDTKKKLIKNKPEINKKDKIPQSITIHIPLNNTDTLAYIDKITTKNHSSVIKRIFEARIANELFDWLMENGCFIYDTCEITQEPTITLNDIINDILAGSEFRKTLNELMQICNKTKRTNAFIDSFFTQLRNAGISIKKLNGEKITEDELKTMSKDTIIVLTQNYKSYSTDYSKTESDYNTTSC